MQYGPFAEAGMAASHVGELEALGLRGLRPQQLLESLLAAGSASGMVYARLQAQRFASIYAAKGRWGLVDQLLWVPVATDRSSAGATLTHAAPVAAPPRPLPPLQQQQASMPLAVVAQTVRKAAEELLGQELDGACAARVCCSLSAIQRRAAHSADHLLLCRVRRLPARRL